MSNITWRLTISQPPIAVQAYDVASATMTGFMNAGAPPQKLTFTGTLTRDASVQVAVGRKNP